MKAKITSVLGLICVLSILATAAFAHRGYAAYDMQTTKSLKGTVTNFMMANPHSQIAIDVRGADGNVENWVLESLGVRGMEELVFHAGLFVNLTLPDGKVIPKSAGSNGN